MGAIGTTSSSIGAVMTGIVKLTVEGTIYRIKGAIDYNLGLPLREVIKGQDGVHGFKETTQEATVEVTSTDGSDYDLAAILTATDVVVSVFLNNGKTITFANCFQAGDGKVNTEEGEFTLKWISMSKGIES